MHVQRTASRLWSNFGRHGWSIFNWRRQSQPHPSYHLHQPFSSPIRVHCMTSISTSPTIPRRKGLPLIGDTLTVVSKGPLSYYNFLYKKYGPVVQLKLLPGFDPIVIS